MINSRIIESSIFIILAKETADRLISIILLVLSIIRILSFLSIIHIIRWRLIRWTKFRVSSYAILFSEK